MTEIIVKNSRGEGIPKKEYKGIDIAKFILAILVVASHTQVSVGSNETINTIYNTILLCVVPFFFLASGFFMYKEQNQEKKLIDNLKKITKLYLLWNLIYLPISIYDYVVKGYSIGKALFIYVRDLLFVGEHFFSWPIWYLLGLIYAIIAIYFLKKLKLSDKKMFIITMLTYIVAFLLDYLIDNCLDNKLVYLFHLVFYTGRVFRGIFLVEQGLLIRKYSNKINLSKKILFLIMFISFTISVIIPNEASRVVLYISLFLLVLQLNNIKINTINFRKCSTIIYFVHMINLFIFLLFVGKEHVYGIHSFILDILICLIESFIIIKLQNKYNFKILKELFNG